MLAHMKMQTTKDSKLATICLDVPLEDAMAVKDAIEKFLILSGHDIKVQSEDSETISYEDMFPETTAGSRLRGLRYREDLTQKKMAKKLDVKQHHISEMESNKRNITVDMAKRIEKAFGVSYKAFL